ncbi:MBL fold metallo-hydrolase [candidate division KSB1 bacterium]|nr:MBL fold metallo-hydrolase [candidate division KSB1 bacterium]
MKKNIFLYAIIFSLVLFCSNLSAQQRETVPVKLKPISDRLYEILGGRGANGGLYIGDNGVMVIDAKMDKQSVDETIAAIKQITDKPIKYLFNTHSDGDHISGNRFFPPTITFIAHENCRKEFFHPGRDGAPSEWNLPDRASFVPSITFRDKMDIYFGSKKVELWYFGVGHTTGDAVVFFPEEKTAFIGDQIFVGRAQLIHSYKGGNSFEHVKTLTKMLDTLDDAEKFCSGHADIIDRLTVTAHINEMKIRQEKIKSFVKAGKTLEEIKTEFPENESGLVEAIFNELTGMK